MLAVVAGVGLAFLIGTNLAEAGKISDIKKRVSNSIFLPKKQTSSTSSSNTKSASSGIFSSPLETVITAGPENNSFVQDIKVTFVLDGWQILPFKKTTNFDVWLVGVDSGWRNASKQVSYNLPPGKQTYTFMARAKIGSSYDVTPVVRNFTIYTSPYFGKISISGINKIGTAKNPEYEKFSITAGNIESPINISGWKVTVKRSRFSFSIPSAQKLYDPRSPSNDNVVVLNKSNSAEILVGRRSPLGVNFQENSCQGYLTGVFESPDSLSGSGKCRLPDSSSYGGFSKECRNFIRGINSCRNVSMVYYQFANEPSCRDFIIKNYNYQSCVERNKDGVDFYLNHWRIYLGRNDEILDDLNDTIYLHDGQGLLVAAASY